MEKLIKFLFNFICWENATDCSLMRNDYIRFGGSAKFLLQNDTEEANERLLRRILGGSVEGFLIV